MQHGTLLLPSSGPDLLRTLNYAAIYSETVHAFAFTDSGKVEALESICDGLASMELLIALSGVNGGFACTKEIDAAQDVEPDASKKAGETIGEIDRYDEFIESQKETATDATLKLAKREGVLLSIGDHAVEQFAADQGASAQSLNAIISGIGKLNRKSFASNVASLFGDAMKDSEPSFASLFEELISTLLGIIVSLGQTDAMSLKKAGVPFEVIGLSQRGDLRDIERMLDDEKGTEIQQLSFFAYMYFAAGYAVANGLTPATCNSSVVPIVSYFVDAIRTSTSGPIDLLSRRCEITNRLGQVVTRELLPNLSELPFEYVLDIRRKRQSEILAFHDGLAAIATDIDCDADSSQLELAIDTKLKTVVKPALSDLNRVVEEIRADAYRRVLEPDTETAMTLIPMMISCGMGAPLEVSAASGVFPLLNKLYQFTVGNYFDRRKVIKASPWSIMFQINEQVRKQKT